MADGDHNPSDEGSWTDPSGAVWKRKGKRGRALDQRRVRSLLGRDDVPLVVWQSFQTETFTDGPAKLTAVERLHSGARSHDDIVASEWTRTDGRRLLMLEHHC